MKHLTIDQLQALADLSLTANVPVSDQFKDGTLYHAFLYLLSQAFNPELIVELGTGTEARGAAHFAAGAPSARIITIDTTGRSGSFPYKNVEFWEKDTRLAGMYLSNINIPIDILFIDSTHEAEHARTEMNLYWPMMRSRGVLLADDVNMGGMEGFYENIPEPKFNHPSLHANLGFAVAVKL